MGGKLSMAGKKVVLVTGGNRGVGFGICKKLAECEDIVVGLCARQISTAKEAVDQIQGKNELVPFEMDVCSESSVYNAVQSLQHYLNQSGNHLYCVINNAGVGYDFPWLKNHFSSDSARKTLDCNFFGVLSVCKATIGLLPPGGRIVHVSSGAGPGNMKNMNELNRNQLLDIENRNMNDLIEYANQFIERYEVLAKNQSEKALPHLDQDSGWWMQSYGFSKALLNCLTRIQARDNPELIVVVVLQ